MGGFGNWLRLGTLRLLKVGLDVLGYIENWEWGGGGGTPHTPFDPDLPARGRVSQYKFLLDRDITTCGGGAMGYLVIAF